MSAAQEAGPYDVLPDRGSIEIGGSRVGRDRVSGPPSIMYPVLRDLGDCAGRKEGVTPRNNATITIEVDLKTRRHVGVITGRSEGLEETLNLRAYRRHFLVPFKNIIGFRVLKVEVEDLPAEL